MEKRTMRITTTNKKNTLELIGVLFEKNISFQFDDFYNCPFESGKVFFIKEQDFLAHKDDISAISGVSVRYF